MLSEFAAASFVFEICSACKKSPVGLNFTLCKSCASKLELWPQETCLHCGEPKSNSRCPVCWDRKFYIDSYQGIFVLNKEASFLLHQAKFNKRKKAIHYIIQTLLKQVSKYKECNAILPIPSSWDFVNIVTKALSSTLQLPVTQAFEKSTKGKIKTMSRAQRFLMISESYKLKENIKIPQTILLFDDVWTTGASMNYCAKLLKDNVNVKVHALTLFRKPYQLETL